MNLQKMSSFVMNLQLALSELCYTSTFIIFKHLDKYNAFPCSHGKFNTCSNQFKESASYLKLSFFLFFLIYLFDNQEKQILSLITRYSPNMILDPSKFASDLQKSAHICLPQVQSIMKQKG